MNIRLLKIGSSIMLAAFASCFFSACDGNEDEPQIVPEVTTAAITNVTSTSAMGGGEIVSDGNADVTASGLVYSKTNATPTVADSKTLATTTSGSFTSSLEGLSSGTTYRVRAYATNSVGTGYGETVTLTTGNNAPTAAEVTISGDLAINATLTAHYKYDDAEDDAENGTTFQWYSATDAAGAEEAAIEGANASTYTILAENEFQFIRVGITPKAETGTTVGTEMKSDFMGPVPEAPETVTFTYNGASVTYGVILSKTNRKWMDRNLGATHVATNFSTDYMARGDLFQWGRGDDGHQAINRQPAGTPETGVNGTVAGPVSTDTPGNSLFITTIWPQGNWRDPYNDNLWQAPVRTNNVCPSGWHVPTNEEWQAEDLSNSFDQLKLTTTGYRGFDDGIVSQAAGTGFYWSSTAPSEADEPTHQYNYTFAIVSGGFSLSGNVKGTGCAVRCIKD